MASSAAMVFAQPENFVIRLDGKILKSGLKSKNADTLYLSKIQLKKFRALTIRFESMNEEMWKRTTWLEKENMANSEKYTYNLPSANGTITIPATHLRTVIKGQNSLEIWTSLKPKNDMMMVRETRELVCKIVID